MGMFGTQERQRMEAGWTENLSYVFCPSFGFSFAGRRD